MVEITMIEWMWPFILLLLPLPWLLHKVVVKNASKSPGLKLPPMHPLAQWLDSSDKKNKNSLKMILIFLIWSTFLIALARPVWFDEPIYLPQEARDILLAIDLSGSMGVEDFELKGRKMNRLEAVQIVAKDFVKRREGDRLGLILFGRNAYLQSPLSFDINTLLIFLDEAQIGLAGQETAIGDAIGLGVKRLKDKEYSSKILVMLTDGANTSGNIPPIKAAELAAQAGIKIYTIGIGATSMVVQTLLGAQQVNPSADLDEEALKNIAEQSGGRYFRARDLSELNDIYQEIDKMEPSLVSHKLYRPSKELFYWPLTVCLAFIGFYYAAALRLRYV